MIARNRSALLLALCVVALSACKETAAPAGDGLDDVFSRTDITVINDDGVEYTFDVYLALNYEQKQRGLMYVRDLPDKSGMLFVYDDAALHSMWMKNTYIPLDMIFAREDGSVSSVIHDTTPLSLVPQGATESVNYVLELNGGMARRLKIGSDSTIQVDALPSK